MSCPAIREATEYTPGPSLGIDCVSGNGHDLISQAKASTIDIALYRERA